MSNRAGFFTKTVIAGSGGALRPQNRSQSAQSIGSTFQNNRVSSQLRLSSEIDSICHFARIPLSLWSGVCDGGDRFRPRISGEDISMTTGPMVFIFCRLVAHVGTATWCDMNRNGAVAAELAPKTWKFSKFHQSCINGIKGEGDLNEAFLKPDFSKSARKSVLKFYTVNLHI